MAYQPPSNPPPGGYYPPNGGQQGGYYPPPEAQQGGYYPPNGGQQGGYYPPPGGQQGGYFPPQGYNPAYAAPPPKKAKKIVDPRTKAHKNAKTAAIVDLVLSCVLIVTWGILMTRAYHVWYLYISKFPLYAGSIVLSILIFLEKLDNLKKKKILIIIWLIWTAIRGIGELAIVGAAVYVWFYAPREPRENGSDSDAVTDSIAGMGKWIGWIFLLIAVLGLCGTYIALSFMMAACLKQINKDLRGEGDPPVPDANERMVN